MKSKIFLFIFIFILLSTLVSANCILETDNTEYLQGETPVVKAYCDSSAEKSQTYTITWANSTNTLEVDTGTTPSSVGENFFESFLIPIDYVGDNITVTMTGINLEGSDEFSVINASSNNLIISDIEFSDDLFLGLEGSMSFLVKDSNDKLVSNARCNVEFLDSQDRPIFVLEAPRTIYGSSAVSDMIAPGTYKEGVQYSSHIHCACGISGTSDSCFNEDAVEISEASGNSIGTFQIDTWFLVNTVVEKDEYLGREEIQICANVTSVDYQSRVPMLIYYQIRCSRGEDNDFDLDRALLTSDDNNPDERGISPNITQTQCKRFVIPEAPYLQGGSNVCYASTNVQILNNKREQIVSYATSSEPFNITVSDLNIYPDWSLVDNYKFVSIVNLSDEKYSAYAREGMSNIDLQLSRDYTESIRSEDQYLKYPLDFNSFIDASRISYVQIEDINGTEVNYSIEVLDDGNIEIEMNNVDISDNGWYNITLIIDNYEERTTLAIESNSKIIRDNNYSLNDYIIGSDIKTDNILESQVIKFDLNVIKEPIYYDDYFVKYTFYDINGNGNLVKEEDVQFTGTIGTKELTINSNGLKPDAINNEYLVKAKYGMKTIEGAINYFDEINIGTIEVNALSGNTRIIDNSESTPNIIDNNDSNIEKSKDILSSVHWFWYVVIVLIILTIVFILLRRNKK